MFKKAHKFFANTNLRFQNCEHKQRNMITESTVPRKLERSVPKSDSLFENSVLVLRPFLLEAV